MPTLLIAASGTGGHLFPALAVAEALPADWRVHWLGVPDRLERQLVPSLYPMHFVRAGGLQGRGLRKLWNLMQLLTATRVVRRLIRREGITAVVQPGGAQRDFDVIEACNQAGAAMVFTGQRCFKH